MKKTLQAVLFTFLFAFTSNTLLIAQTQVFFDNFSSGTTKWTLSGSWGLTTANYHSASKSLTDSPSGDYTNIQNTSAASIGFDLSSYLGAQLTFWTKYALESSFDFVYLEISKDGGTNYIQLDQFTGTSSTWQKHTYNIGSFAGNSNVKIRFRFYSDQFIVADGMYIDDVEILGLDTDDSAPLVLHQAPQYYQGTQTDYTCNADITDVSGISAAYLYYSVDGGSKNIIAGNHVSGSQYSFTIPEQTAGSTVTYKIQAIDNYVSLNQTDTSTATAYKFISGSYISYDNANVDEVATISGNSAAAVKMTIPTGMYGKLVSVLIRNYRDPNLSNSDMLFHVWSNNNGVPGTDLIIPFLVTPEATLTNPFPFTKIDLRDYSEELHDLTNDIFVGFTVPNNSVNIVVSGTPHNRSYNFNGSTWSLYSKDYEFRAVMNITSYPMPVELTSFTASCVDDNVELIWRTATEVNNYGFEIYRCNQISVSESNKNEEVWNWVGFVNGNGNSNSPNYYFFIDSKLNTSGKYFYKLKQIDIDGKSEYSPIAEVEYNGPVKNELNQNYPNPFNPSTIIKWQTTVECWQIIKIYDILGKEISTLVNERKPAGNYEVEFNASQLPSGIYFYQLTAGSFVQTKKMIVTK